MSNLVSKDFLKIEKYQTYFGIMNDQMMMFLDDSLPKDSKLISPYFCESIREKNGEKIASYGQSSFGYDIRAADEFKIYSNVNAVINDPKNITEDNFINVKGKGHVIIPPNAYVLTRSMEKFNLPRDITGVAWGKSTLARAGLIVNVTPLEAGWEGYLTIEISNATPMPAKLYAEEGVAQIVFFKGEECKVSYLDRKGKYQGQGAEIVLPKR